MFIIIIILIIAFITNPTKKDHNEKAIEFIVEISTPDDSVLFEEFNKLVVNQKLKNKVKFNNYYIFSISHFNISETNKRFNIGLGLFGKIIPLGSKNKFDRLTSTASNTDSKIKVAKESPKKITAEKNKQTKSKTINEADRIAEEKKQKEDKKKKLDALIGGVGKDIDEGGKGKLNEN